MTILSHGPDASAQARRSVDTTLEHIERISRKIALLQAAQIEAEEALCAAAGRAYNQGHLSVDYLCDVYVRYRSAATKLGFGKRWNAAVSMTTDEINAYRFRPRNEPNGPFGSWHGEGNRIARYDPRPPDGQAVVYVLYDAALRPCYVGSSEKFAQRIMAHRCSGKDFTSWRAYPCTDREHAYAEEDRLLREHAPYLNKRAGR